MSLGLSPTNLLLHPLYLWGGITPVTYYRIKVSIGEAEFKGKATGDIEVRPGMTATADVKTGHRSVLSFILKPLTKTLNESLGER